MYEIKFRFYLTMALLRGVFRIVLEGYIFFELQSTRGSELDDEPQHFFFCGNEYES